MTRQEVWPGQTGLSARSPHRASARAAALAWYAALLAVVAIASPGARAAALPVTAAQVETAINKGVAYLWTQQLADGTWEEPAPPPAAAGAPAAPAAPPPAVVERELGGYTALVVYALLTAGEKPQDPRMVKAVDYLKKVPMTGTYCLGMRCLVWSHLPATPERLRLMQEDAARLLAGYGRAGPKLGMWDYLSIAPPPKKKPPTRYDHSVSQYGVLGLWACELNGVAIGTDHWRAIDAAWRAHQNLDGGWSYETSNNKLTTASMTAAGVATLFITQDMIGTPASCKGNLFDLKIENGVGWLGRNWDKVGGAYALYGIERIGTASGYKHIGPYDWYAIGSERFVKSQGADGSWKMGQKRDVADTSFGILFLCHGRAPVIVNKLDYSVSIKAMVAAAATQPGAATAPAVPPAAGATAAAPTTAPTTGPVLEQRLAPWNQRPRDVANVIRFTGRGAEELLNWQVINLQAPVDELHDAPIIYIAGSRALDFTPAEDAKLKQFVEEGGLILANADCPAEGTADDPFTASVKKLGGRLFGGRAFRPLPSNHVILNEQQYKSSRWPSAPVVLGLSNGVRELILLIPQGDAGRRWHANAIKDEAWAFELGSDVCLYAVDKQLERYKGITYLVRPPAGAAAGFDVRVARLKIGDNWDPEPAGWRRLDAICRTAFQVAINAVPVAPEPNALKGFKVAHLTGTTPVTLTAAQRLEIQRFVKEGGTLIVDAAGGNAEFADAAEKELVALFGASPGHVGELMPLTHAAYKLPAATITAVDYRSYARRHAAGKLGVPRVRGVEQGGRVVAFFSREDLSGGMVGQPVDGVMGYSPESATAIMRNLVVFSAMK